MTELEEKNCEHGGGNTQEGGGSSRHASKAAGQVLLFTAFVLATVASAFFFVSAREDLTDVIQPLNTSGETLQRNTGNLLQAITTQVTQLQASFLGPSHQKDGAVYNNETSIETLSANSKNYSSQLNPLEPTTEWRPQVLEIARRAYQSWKKVQDAKEPDTVAGVISRLNNTSFKWVSQMPSAQPCASPPCYENKRFGGDDYFVVITTADFREHVATCTDHEDGTYTFRFDATCGEEVVGNMSVVLEFSHGNALTLDKKLAYLLRRVLLHAPNTVIRADPATGKEEMMVRRAQFVQAPGLLDRFDTIVAFGCSLTQQITTEAMKQSGRKIYHYGPLSPLNTRVLQAKFIDPLKQWDKLYEEAKDKSKFAVIFNSGIWDVLLPASGSELNHPPEDMYADHLQALSDWADHIRGRFPEAAIFFKETTTLHAHETMCSFIHRAKIRYKCQARNMFMAGALTNLLRQLQNTMMRIKKMPILLQYDTTYRHPSFALDGDGRHFNGPLNDIMWKSWTYIDGQWTTQLLCPNAFYTWMASVHPEQSIGPSKGLARSYDRAHIQF